MEHVPQKQDEKPHGVEPEHRGSIWTHPYMLYMVLTAGLFVALLLIGALAFMGGVIPNRGI